jgi:hypothetical protein
MIYPAGTFREDRSTIGKEFGASNKELLVAREQTRRDGFEAGVIAVLEKEGILELDILKDKSRQVIEGLATWAMKMITDKESSRDAVAFLKLYVDKIDHKDEVIAKLKEKKTFTMDEAQEWLEFTEKAMKIAKQETESAVVDAKLYDVSGESDDEEPESIN